MHHQWYVGRRSANYNFWSCRHCDRKTVKMVRGFGTPDLYSIVKEQCSGRDIQP